MKVEHGEDVAESRQFQAADPMSRLWAMGQEIWAVNVDMGLGDFWALKINNSP